MENDRELMQQALDALLRVWHSERNTKHSEAIDALRVRLAQPESGLPPLPDAFDWHKQPMTGWYGKVYTEEQMQEYAAAALKQAKGGK